MSKLLRITIASLFLMSLLVPATALAVDFANGEIAIQLNDFGRVRVHAPAIDGDIQIDRSSVLVGVSSDAVYDYWEDGDTEVTPVVVDDPQLSDVELYGVFNNNYSGEPPNVLIHINVYGWNSGAYCLVKFTVENMESEAIDAIMGLELLPQINGEYGNESMAYLTDADVVNSYKTGSHVGYKFMTTTLTSLKIFDWYDGYNDGADADFYDWLTYGQIDENFTAGIDGAVGILGMDSVNLGPGESVEFYTGVAVGGDQAEMLSNMDLAEAALGGFLAIEDEEVMVLNQVRLDQNYPNPFNPNTAINFNVPSPDHVTLSVYNTAGQLIETLVDRDMEAGYHTANFQADDLSSGLYFYTLNVGGQQITKRMTLLK